MMFKIFAGFGPDFEVGSDISIIFLGLLAVIYMIVSVVIGLFYLLLAIVLKKLYPNIFWQQNVKVVISSAIYSLVWFCFLMFDTLAMGGRVFQTGVNALGLLFVGAESEWLHGVSAGYFVLFMTGVHIVFLGILKWLDSHRRNLSPGYGYDKYST